MHEKRAKTQIGISRVAKKTFKSLGTNTRDRSAKDTFKKVMQEGRGLDDQAAVKSHKTYQSPNQYQSFDVRNQMRI